jgi:hypothetical protein
MAIVSFKRGDDDEDMAEKLAQVMGPGQIDKYIRHAIQFCWMSIPKKRRNVKELEKQARRIFERALRDFREDSDQFLRGE